MGTAVWLSLPNFRARSALVARLVETFITDDTVFAEYRRIGKRLKGLASNRNQLAHSIGGDLDTWSHHVFRVDGDSDQGPIRFSQRRRFTLASIESWARDMHALKAEMGVFLRERLEPNMQASPRKSPQQPLA